MANIANFFSTLTRFPVRVYKVVASNVFLSFILVVNGLLRITRTIDRQLLMIVDIMVKYNPEAAKNHDLNDEILVRISHFKSWIEVLETILIVHPNTVRETNSEGVLPVQFAACFGTVEVMEKLLELYPESASMVFHGNNLMHLVVLDRGNTVKDKVRFLCSKYPTMMDEMHTINHFTPLKMASFIKNSSALQTMCEMRGQELISMPNNEYNMMSLHQLIFYLSTPLRNSPLSMEADYFRKLLHLYPEAAGIQVNASIMQPAEMPTTFEYTVHDLFVSLMMFSAAVLGFVAGCSIVVRVDVDIVNVNVVLVVMAAVVVAVLDVGIIAVTGAAADAAAAGGGGVGRYLYTAGAGAGVVAGAAAALYINVAACYVACYSSAVKIDGAPLIATVGLLVVFFGLVAAANFWVVVRFAGDAVGAAFAVGVGGFYVAVYVASRPAGLPLDGVVAALAAFILIVAVTLTIRLGLLTRPEDITVAGVPVVAATANATDGINDEGNIDGGNIDFDNVEFDNLPEDTVFYMANRRALWHTRMVPYQLAVDKNLPSYYLRLLLRAAPDLNPAELVRLNYEERRMALILAYMPTSDGKPTLRHPPSLLTRLLEHGDDKELLKYVVSFL